GWAAAGGGAVAGDGALFFDVGPTGVSRSGTFLRGSGPTGASKSGVSGSVATGGCFFDVGPTGASRSGISGGAAAGAGGFFFDTGPTGASRSGACRSLGDRVGVGPTGATRSSDSSSGRFWSGEERLGSAGSSAPAPNLLSSRLTRSLADRSSQDSPPSSAGGAAAGLARGAGAGTLTSPAGVLPGAGPLLGDCTGPSPKTVRAGGAPGVRMPIWSAPVGMTVIA